MFSRGDVIGPYTLIRSLGRGGFGEVWLGENSSPVTPTAFAVKIAHNPNVSLREIKKEADIWKQVDNHPNILFLIEANQYGQHVVIVSRYMPDGSLENYLTKHKGPLPLKSAINVAQGILKGLQHLHEAKIIHRDLKPANILLQDFVPQIADFGLSSVLRSTSISSTVAGTPAYMAPEAFNRRRTAQVDVWSAGIILYEMMAGHLPFSGASVPEMIEVIRKRRPAPLPPEVPPAIQQVIAKALQKKKANRYKSAAEMRKALLEAAKSIPDDSQVSTVMLTSTKKSPDVNIPSLLRALRSPRILTALGLVVFGIVFAALTMLPNSTVTQKGGTPGEVPSKATSGQSVTNLGVMTAQAQPSQPYNLQDRVASISFSPDGKTLAAAVFDGTLRMWDATSGIVKRTLKGSKFGVISVAFSPNGNLMADMNSDATISLWDMRTVEIKQTLAHNPQKDFGSDTGAVAFSPDGRVIASIHHDGVVKLWDILTGNLIRTLDFGFKGNTPSLTFSPDGKLLASGNGDWSREGSGEVRVWNTRTGELVRTLKPEGARNWIMSVAFSPDGKTLAVGTQDAKINVWSIPSGELRQVLKDNFVITHALAFSPDGKTLVTGGTDKTVRFWDTHTWTVKNSLSGHSSLVRSLAFSHDGKMFASGGEDNSVIVWDALTGIQRLKLQAHD